MNPGLDVSSRDSGIRRRVCRDAVGRLAEKAVTSTGWRVRLVSVLSMILILLALIVVSAPSPSKAAAGSSVLRVDETLRGSSSHQLRSDNGRFRLVMQQDGNLVLYSADNRALWWTGTLGGSDRRLVMQKDGNLVVYDGASRPLWSSATVGVAGATLTLQNDGNPVVSAPGYGPLWSAYTGLITRPATPVSGCSWPRCTFYADRAETRAFAYEGRLPGRLLEKLGRAAIPIQVGVAGHQWFARQYYEQGRCIRFTFSVYPWEGRGMDSWSC